MNKERISYLLKASQAQNLTLLEKAEYNKILGGQAYEDLIDQILDQSWNDLTHDDVDGVVMTNYDQILLDIKKQPQTIHRRMNWPFRMMIAAAVVLVVLTASFYYFNGRIGNNETVQFTNDIAPGKNGATLTLANGKKIFIGDALSGNIAKESGVKISKSKDGMLIYEITNDDTEATDLTNSFNTLTTTSGEQLQVKLQDGTLVFLNTESSLKYPTSFKNGKTRKVSLTGEAYFDVTKDKAHPFIVDMVSASGKTDKYVQVLGTSFNISNYADESVIKTTLLEGSVNLVFTAPDNGKPQTLNLKPNEQAVITEKSQQIKIVEVEDVVSWKNGYFMFNNETLESIMKKVARWYNADVIFKDEAIKQKTFFGSVSRFDNVSEVLKLLQKTEGASFQISGRQIIVNKK